MVADAADAAKCVSGKDMILVDVGWLVMLEADYLCTIFFLS